MQVSGLHWLADSDVLTLAVPREDALELAVVPSGQELTGPVELTVDLAATDRTLSAPASPQNPIIRELGAAPRVAGQCALSWLQTVPGDYNQDGAVDLRDVRPLAPYWQRVVDRTANDAENRPIFWLDGNEDGKIDSKDADLVRENIGLVVAGYRVMRNCKDVPGTSSLGITLQQSQAARRNGLPSAFVFTGEGNSTDFWHVIPVDPKGAPVNRGVGCGGGTVEVHLIFDGDVGLIDNPDLPRFSTRVIDPIELIGGSGMPSLNGTIVGNTITYDGVPQDKVLIGDIGFVPAISLNGASRAISAAENFSQRTTASLAFSVPRNTNHVLINAHITLTANASGALIIKMRTQTSADGGPAYTSLSQLDYERAELRRDTDADGRLDDELAFADSDRDMLSNAQVAELVRHPGLADFRHSSVLVTGKLAGYDLRTGELMLSNVIPAQGSGVDVPSTLKVRIAENVRQGLCSLAPALPSAGRVAMTLQLVDEPAASIGYWASSLHQLSPAAMPQAPLLLTTADQPGGGKRIMWQAPAGYSSFRIVRSASPYQPYGPGSMVGFNMPGMLPNLQQDLPAVSSYIDLAARNGFFAYDLYGYGPGRQLVYLGSSL
jgi:hypothetical protein